jgi:hypothetical protein
MEEGDKDNDHTFNEKLKVTVAGGRAKGGKGRARRAPTPTSRRR